MHLLLPPSEGKNSGGRGRPLRARPEDGHPLAAGRRTTIRSLLQLVRTDTDSDTAARALLLPTGVAAAALAANSRVLDSPTVPALRRYAGVVYEGLDVASLTASQQRLALRSTWIFSGLFGVLRGDEPVPDYRVPGKAVLPGVGIASTFWRPVLADVLPVSLRRGLVIDLRSSDYSAMWRPGPETADRVLTVRILSPAPRGGHAVISYTSKFAKGLLAAALLRRADGGGRVDTTADVLQAWDDAGGVGAVRTSPTSVDLYTA